MLKIRVNRPSVTFKASYTSNVPLCSRLQATGTRPTIPTTRTTTTKTMTMTMTMAMIMMMMTVTEPPSPRDTCLSISGLLELRNTLTVTEAYPQLSHE
ncbi:hypothetical protein M0804_011584 [Polistes exclamans]|nr:hypothetical protein M0804_011584 [Polistes exclamans]